MGISAEEVKKLREMTGAGMMDCKSALSEAGGDFEKAVDVLRKKGLKDVSKRASKVASEGTMGVYLHAGDQVVGIVELLCETDFVARGTEFKETAKGIAMHVAAMSPKYLTPEEVPSEVLDREKDIFMEQLSDVQKKNADKILPGKIAKFYEDNCLLEQPYIKDDSGKKKVRDVVQDLSARCGEKVELRRFSRLEVGEGIEKAQANLAEDVAALTAGA